MNIFFSQITEIITTFVLIAVLFTLNHEKSKLYIKDLIPTFISYGLLLILSFIRDQFYSTPTLFFITFMLLFITTFLAVKSSFVFYDIKITKHITILSIIIYLGIISLFALMGIEILAEGFGYFILGSSLIFLGIQWASHQLLRNGQNKIIGIVFIILGTHFLTFIFLQNSQNFFSYGYYFASFLEMVLTFFIVKTYLIELSDIYHLQNDKYVNFFENSSDAIMLFASEGITECNNRTSEMFQYPKDKIINKLPSYFSPVYQANGKKSKVLEATLLNNAMLGKTERFEWIHQAKDGTEIFCEVSLFKTSDNLIGSVTRDITASIANKEALTFHVNYDALTKLPKRSLFIDRLERSLAYTENIIALLALDIDNFKGINDQYGHEFGDQVLVRITHLIKQALGDSITMTRLGGDEFIILLENLSSKKWIVHSITKIEKIFEKGIKIDDKVIHTSVCIGIVFPDSTNHDPIHLIKNVDLALNQAKQRGRGQIEFYSKTSDMMFNERVTLEKEMIDGIKNNEFIPYFQPIVDAKTHEIIGAEALMRWIRKDSDQIFPDVFIPIAEDTSLIIGMGETILRQSCLACLEILDYIPEFTVNVNLSPIQLQSSDIVSTIKNVLAETGLPARHLEVEVTENILLEDEEIATDILQKIRALGVLVSLDDFGTGYSSLSYLNRLQIDTVKIDRAFIVNIPRNTRSNLMLESIIKLIHNLEYKIVAEGVEEKDQVEFIKLLGCDKIQGYYFYRPMPLDELKPLIQGTHK